MADVIHGGMTEAQYKLNRKKMKKRNALTHPSWHDVDKAKAKCTPQGVVYEEREVRVPVKWTMYHQMFKILKDHRLVKWMQKLAKNPNVRFELVFKWGADGSSAHSHYRNAKNDSKIFASNAVPIFIEALDTETGECVNVWCNPFANSAFGVVPLRWAFEDENGMCFAKSFTFTGLEAQCLKIT